MEKRKKLILKGQLTQKIGIAPCHFVTVHTVNANVITGIVPNLKAVSTQSCQLECHSI